MALNEVVPGLTTVANIETPEQDNKISLLVEELRRNESLPELDDAVVGKRRGIAALIGDVLVTYGQSGTTRGIRTSTKFSDAAVEGAERKVGLKNRRTILESQINREGRRASITENLKDARLSKANAIDQSRINAEVTRKRDAKIEAFRREDDQFERNIGIEEQRLANAQTREDVIRAEDNLNKLEFKREEQAFQSKQLQIDRDIDKENETVRQMERRQNIRLEQGKLDKERAFLVKMFDREVDAGKKKEQRARLAFIEDRAASLEREDELLLAADEREDLLRKQDFARSFIAANQEAVSGMDEQTLASFINGDADPAQIKELVTEANIMRAMKDPTFADARNHLMGQVINDPQNPDANISKAIYESVVTKDSRGRPIIDRKLLDDQIELWEFEARDKIKAFNVNEKILGDMIIEEVKASILGFISMKNKQDVRRGAVVKDVGRVKRGESEAFVPQSIDQLRFK